MWSHQTIAIVMQIVDSLQEKLYELENGAADR